MWANALIYLHNYFADKKIAPVKGLRYTRGWRKLGGLEAVVERFPVRAQPAGDLEACALRMADRFDFQNFAGIRAIVARPNELLTFREHRKSPFKRRTNAAHCARYGHKAAVRAMDKLSHG